MKSGKAVIAMVVATALWGAMGLFTRNLDQCSLSPVDITAVRVSLTALVLFIVLMVIDRKSFILTKRLVPYAIGLGIAKVVASYSMIYAQILIPLAYANTLQTMYIFIVLFVSMIVLSEKVSWLKAAAAAVSVVGCVLVVFTGGESGDLNVLGVCLALISAGGLAADAILVKAMYIRGARPQSSLFYSYLVPALILLPVADLGGIMDVAVNVEGALLDMFSLAVLVTLVPYFLENWSYTRLNINSVSILNALEIVFVAVIGFVFFSEELTIVNIVGILMVIAATIAANMDVGINMNRINMEMARKVPEYSPDGAGANRVGGSGSEGSIRDRIFHADKATIFKSLKSLFYEKKWQFERKGDYAISAAFMGDDLVINTDIVVDDKIVKFNCVLSLDAQEEHYVDVLWKLNEINDSIQFGSFRLNPELGKICFQYSYLFVDARPTPMLLESLVSMVVQTVDDHDGFLRSIAGGDGPADLPADA